MCRAAHWGRQIGCALAASRPFSGRRRKCIGCYACDASRHVGWAKSLTRLRVCVRTDRGQRSVSATAKRPLGVGMALGPGRRMGVRHTPPHPHTGSPAHAHRSAPQHSGPWRRAVPPTLSATASEGDKAVMVTAPVPLLSRLSVPLSPLPGDCCSIIRNLHHGVSADDVLVSAAAA